MGRHDRKAEIRRRRLRREKLRKLRARYRAARTQAERERVIAKARRISPYLRPEEFLKPLEGSA